MGNYDCSADILMDKLKTKVRVPVESFAPHKWHLDILQRFDDREARFFLLNWHRRARKSTLLLNLLIREAIENKNKVFGYVAPTYRQARSIIWRDPMMLMNYLPPECVKRVNDTEMFVEFKPSNSILMVKGADDPDALRGIGFYGLGMDEWALQKREVWEEILRPVITENNGFAIFAFTPKGQNHSWEYWNRSVAWKNWYRSELKASKSGLISEKGLAEAKEESGSPLVYQQEYECEFIKGGAGRFFQEWDENVHIVAPFTIPEEWTKFISIDYGYSAPASVGWWAVGFEGQLYRYRELYAAKMTYSELAYEILRRNGNDVLEYGVADPSIWGDKAHHKGDVAGESGAETMGNIFSANSKEIVERRRQLGIPDEIKIYLQRGDNSRITGWGRMREFLKSFTDQNGETAAKLQVFSNCSNFIRTFPLQVYDTNNVEDLDTDGEDHAADESRYAVMSRPILPVRKKPALTDTQAFWHDVKEERRIIIEGEESYSDPILGVI